MTSRTSFLAILLSATLTNFGFGQEKFLFEKAVPAWTLPWDADWVTAVTFVGPTRTLVAGNKIGQIMAWNLPDKVGAPLPAPTLRCEGHTNQISALVGTPDGRYVVSAGYDHALRLWDFQAAPKGKTMVTLKSSGKKSAKDDAPVSVALLEPAKVVTAHTEWVRSIALSPDGKHLVSGDDKGLIILWTLPDFTEVKRFQVKGWIQALALSPDVKSLVACESSVRYSNFPNAITQFDIATGQTKNLGETLKRDKGQQTVLGIASAAYSRDGSKLAFAVGGEIDGNTGKILLVEAATGKRLHEIPGHLSGNTAVVFHPDGQHLLTAGRDTVVRVWRLSDAKQVIELGKTRGGQFRDWLHSIAITPDGQWIAGADMAGMIHTWHVPK